MTSAPYALTTRQLFGCPPSPLDCAPFRRQRLHPGAVEGILTEQHWRRASFLPPRRRCRHGDRQSPPASQTIHLRSSIPLVFFPVLHLHSDRCRTRCKSMPPTTRRRRSKHF